VNEDGDAELKRISDISDRISGGEERKSLQLTDSEEEKRDDNTESKR